MHEEEGQYYQKECGHPLERLKIKSRGKSCACHLEAVIDKSCHTYGDVVPRDHRKDCLRCRYGFEIKLLLMQAALHSQLVLGGHLD